MALPCGLCPARSRSAGSARSVPRNPTVRWTRQSGCHCLMLAPSVPVPRKSPAIVDEGVGAAETGDGRRQRRRPVVLAGHVEMQVDGGLTGPGDGLSRLPTALV